LGWRRRRKPPSTPDSFTAHPVRLFGSTSLNSRHMPRRHGRVAMEPPRRRLNPRGVASEMLLPKPRGQRRAGSFSERHVASSRVTEGVIAETAQRLRVTAGPGLFSRSAIRFIQPSFVLWRWSIVGNRRCLSTVLVARLLLASLGPSDSLRILVFAHAGLRASQSNPPAADTFRSVFHPGRESSAWLLTTVFWNDRLSRVVVPSLSEGYHMRTTVIALATATALSLTGTLALAQSSGGGSAGGTSGGGTSTTGAASGPSMGSGSAVGTPNAGAPGAGTAAVSGVPSGPANAGGLNNSANDPSGAGNAQKVPTPPGTNTLGTANATGSPNAVGGSTTGMGGRRIDGTVTPGPSMPGDVDIKAEDSKVDAKIKSICRGC